MMSLTQLSDTKWGYNEMHITPFSTITMMVIIIIIIIIIIIAITIIIIIIIIHCKMPVI